MNQKGVHTTLTLWLLQKLRQFPLPSAETFWASLYFSCCWSGIQFISLEWYIFLRKPGNPVFKLALPNVMYSYLVSSLVDSILLQRQQTCYQPNLYGVLEIRFAFVKIIYDVLRQ